MRYLILTLLILIAIPYPAFAQQSAPVSVEQDQPNEQRSKDQSPPDPDSKPRDQVTYPPNSHIRLEDIETALKEFLNDQDQLPESEKEQREKSDLQAQQDMAKYTLWMFALGVLGLLLGMAGTWLIYATLRETQGAAKITEKALVVTQDTSYKELRAYLGVASIHAVPISDGDESLMVDVTITNHGQTPAYNIRIVNTLHASHVLWGPKDEQTTAILNPSEHFTPRITSKFKNVEIVRTKEKFFLNLHIVFTDMNSKERWLKLIFVKDGNDWPEEQATMVEPRPLSEGGPRYEMTVVGVTQMSMAKMETGDLTDEPYKM